LVRILFDENLSHRHAEFLQREYGRRFECEIAHVRNLGLSGVPEATFLEQVTREGWVFVTYDRDPNTRGHTIAQRKSFGVKEILLGRFFDHMNGWERAKWLVNNIESIAGYAATIQPGTIVLWRKRDALPKSL
jgi:hypothetical protein